MQGKPLTKSATRQDDDSCGQTSWLSWCRLCAKREENGQENSSIFVENELGKSTTELTTSIGKYFWVNIKAEDEISKRLCAECRQLIEELILFTERVNKVQTLYVLLQNLKPSTLEHANKLRTQCGLIDEGWEHIIKTDKPIEEPQEVEQPKEVETPKPVLKDQECQTDLMIYLNSGTPKQKQIPKRKSAEKELIQTREDIIKDLTKQLQDEPEDEPENEPENELENEHENELENEPENESGNNQENEPLNENDPDQLPIEEAESEHTYEYILQEDGELDFVTNETIVKQEFSPEVRNMAQQKMDEDMEEDEEEDEEQAQDEEDEEIHDTDLFKELKFKIEEEYETKFNKKFKFSSGNEDIVLEYQQSGGNSYPHESAKQGQEIVPEDFQHNEDPNNSGVHTKTAGEQKVFDLLAKRKRGRPSGSNTTTITSRLMAIRYECKECNRKYKNPNIYRKHMQNAHDVLIDKLPDFMCPECQKDCLTESRLRNHMRLHLPDEEKLFVPCPFCEKKFSQVGAMKQHVNGIHHQMKPFICDQCGRACKTMAALHEHQLVHTDECPFECEVCHKRFKNKPRLKTHMDCHTKMAYTCPDCGLELNTRRTLLQHRLVHSDAKPFKCEFCDATFKRTKALKNHLILHSGLRPYACSFCDKTFSNGSNCRAHKKRAHPLALAEEEAMGIKTTPKAVVPKLEELKSAKTALTQPRKVRRRGGLSDHIRSLIMAAEKRKIENLTDEMEDDATLENYDYSDMHYQMDDSDIEEEQEEEILEDNPELGEECEETVIYEIIDEI